MQPNLILHDTHNPILKDATHHSTVQYSATYLNPHEEMPSRALNVEADPGPLTPVLLREEGRVNRGRTGWGRICAQ